jgi:hypothetical protein
MHNFLDNYPYFVFFWGIQMIHNQTTEHVSYYSILMFGWVARGILDYRQWQSVCNIQKSVAYSLDLDGWTEHLVVPFVKIPTDAQRSSGFLLIRYKFFYPDMFQHIVAILRGSWVPDKLLKQCSVLWVCADCDLSHVASCRGQLATQDGS